MKPLAKQGGQPPQDADRKRVEERMEMVDIYDSVMLEKG
jgi:hypothetical protein